MNKLFYFLVLTLIFACNSGADQPQQSEMKFAAVLPSGQRYDTLANGDTLFYISKDTTVSYTYKTAVTKDTVITIKQSTVKDTTGSITYPITRVELHPKSQAPVDTIVIPPTGQSYPLAFTQIPYSAADLNRPAAGSEQWHDRNDVDQVGKSLDRYQRFVATRIATATRGVYNWSFFDNLVRECITNNQRLSFGYMTVYADGNETHGLVKFSDGSLASYPEWLNNLMLANSNTSLRSWKYGNVWIPNYNSVDYSNWLLELNKAIDTHIKSTTINGVPMRNVVNIIDIRGVGNWGEWHHYPYVGEYPNKLPAGRMPTYESLKRIIDAHLLGFPDNPLVAMISAHDREYFVNTWTPPAISDYLATAKNNWGGVGYRNDHWGGLDAYTWKYLDHPALANVWKTGYITGEPPGSIGGTNNMGDLVRQVTKYHVAMIGNGNMGDISGNTTVKNNFREAAKRAGYRLAPVSGEIKTGSKTIGITLTWQNSGITPIYENWDVVFEAVSSAGIVTNLKSKFSLKLFQPGTATIQDAFALPSGNYKVNLKIIDPTGYRLPMPLFIQGANPAGSYFLKDITIP